MDAMTVRTYSDFHITGCPLLSMDARLVLLELIHPEAGIVFLHQFGIGMARCAKLGDLSPLDLSFPVRSAAHRFVRIITVRIATVAAGACESFLEMDVLAELLRRDSKRFRQILMAIETGVLGLC
jgi:hypothetical protein